MLDVKIINLSKHPLPEYATALSAGMDLRANIDAPVTIQPLQRVLFSTGIKIQLPAGYEAQIRPRSGLAIKHGVTVCNAPGTIDADYTGVIGVDLINMSDEPFTVYDGDRIAQMVIAKYEVVNFISVTTLETTERGSGGYGHTGLK